MAWTDPPTGGSGEANTASNLPGGTGVFAGKVGVDLRFRSLVAGANVAISSDADTITLTSTGPAGGSGSIPTLKEADGGKARLRGRVRHAAEVVTPILRSFRIPVCPSEVARPSQANPASLRNWYDTSRST